MIGPLRPVRTARGGDTGSPDHWRIHRWWWCRASALSLYRCSASLASSSSLRLHPRALFFSLPPYSRYELLRARCLDRCGLVGRMVRWLVERPSPDPPAASIPIASFCLLPRLSDRAHAHKYASRTYARLFSIHFNAQSSVCRTYRRHTSFTLVNVSRWWSACESHRCYLPIQRD